MPVSRRIHPRTGLIVQVARGFARAGQGLPDEARAARYILKDYVAGKLLYSHPPPGVDADTFNARARELARARLGAAGKKLAPTTRVGKSADTYVPTMTPSVDREFFESGGLAASAFVKGGKPFIRARMFPHQNTIGDDGRASVDQTPDGARSKKHNKGNKRAKQRSGRGYE